MVDIQNIVHFAEFQLITIAYKPDVSKIFIKNVKFSIIDVLSAVIFIDIVL